MTRRRLSRRLVWFLLFAVDTSMTKDRQSPEGRGAGRLAISVNKQTEWLLLKVQSVFQGTPSGSMVYMSTDMGKAMSKTTVRRVSVVMYLFAVSCFAVGFGFYYTMFWKPCPKNFFYKSLRPCPQGCDNGDYNWNKTDWYDQADSYCGNKQLNCTTYV